MDYLLTSLLALLEDVFGVLLIALLLTRVLVVKISQELKISVLAS